MASPVGTWQNRGSDAAGTLAAADLRAMVSAKFAGQGCSSCEAQAARGEPRSHQHGSQLPIAAMAISHAPRAGPRQPAAGQVTPQVRASTLGAAASVYSLPLPLKLEDAQERARLHPGSFHVPSLSKCRAARIGDLVELMFSGHADVGPGEHIWAELVQTDSKRGEFVGLLTHMVLMAEHPSTGDLIRFGPRNILDVIPREQALLYQE